MLEVALNEARVGFGEGGIPVGAALFAADGTALGRGHNRQVQEDDPSVHACTDAFRRAGRQHDYPSMTMVSTLSPCWYCAGLIRQYGIGHVVVGETRTYAGVHEWLSDAGVQVTLFNDERCADLMTRFIANRPDEWKLARGSL